MDKLPNELLYLILENLDYWDLRLHIPSVCHRFQDILARSENPLLSSSTLDKLLFRDTVTAIPAHALREEGKNIEYRLHPIFLQGTVDESRDPGVHYLSRSQAEDVIVQDSRFAQCHLYDHSVTYHPLSELPSLTENLTSPAIDKVSFIYDSNAYEDYCTVDNYGTAVTVKDLIQTMRSDFNFGKTDICEVTAWWKKRSGGIEWEENYGAILGLVDTVRNIEYLFYLEIEGVREGCLHLKYLMPEKRGRKQTE